MDSSPFQDRKPVITYTHGNQQEEHNGSPHLQGWPYREASLPRRNSLLYQLQIHCNIPIKKKKKKEKNQFISQRAGMEKKKLYKSRQASLHTTSKSSEAGGVKTIPNFPERPFLWKRYFTLLPSGPNGEQLKSKAMCTKSISKPRSTWQHRYDAFGLLLGPLILF